MKIIKTEQYILFTPKPKSTFNDFLNKFRKISDTYIKDNLIIDLLIFSLTNEELNLFKNYFILKQENGTSFVIIKDNISMDDFSEEMVLVPTQQEAIDIIEMDEITRSLDF